MTKVFIEWNNQYRIYSQRDVYKHDAIPIRGYNDAKYPYLRVQFLQNQYNDYIPKRDHK